MPKVPSSFPGGLICDKRLPEAALAYRRNNAPPLLSTLDLGGLNITAWLYRDESGAEQIQVNPNITIAELRSQFGPAATPDAEVGFHSEGRAAQFFKEHQRLKVLAIFSERIPCPYMCAPMLRHDFPGVPWFYYYNKSSWRGSRGELLLQASEVLKTAYQLGNA